jgi:hypothetical protein
MCHKVTAFYRCERRSARVFFRPSLPGLVDLLTSYPGRLPYQRHEYNQGIEGCRPGLNSDHPGWDGDGVGRTGKLPSATEELARHNTNGNFLMPAEMGYTNLGTALASERSCHKAAPRSSQSS